jgi:small-conductance mechanosensitive channel
VSAEETKAEERQVEVEQLKQRDDVKRALEQTTGQVAEKPKPPVAAKHKLFLGTYFIVLAALGTLYYLLSFSYFGLGERAHAYLQRYTRGAILIVVVLLIAQFVNAYLISRLDIVSRYNLKRVLRLITGFVIAFLIFAAVFINWYTAVVSVGLLSLILGFALQTPMTSFIGWIYILVRQPYRVGDRIKIGSSTGDVIDVSYLDTTLWEFGGDYLSTDHPSGRIIKFPNSQVLGAHVYNYSWALFPYIWNEIKFQVAYNSDLKFIAETMQRVAEEEVGEAMMERIRTFRELLAQTPVDQLQVKERPAVFFRVSENTWLEAIVRYVVPPREAGRIKNQLIRRLLAELNKEPSRVGFPKGDAR